MFYQNIYTDEYFGIINAARSRLPVDCTRKQAKLLLGYVERHHIIPKSMGGDDTNENLVWLTASEHLHVHLLLPKMLINEQDIRKMSLAAVRMANPQSKTQKRIVGDTHIPQISTIREEAARLHSAYMSIRNSGKNNPFYGKTHSEYTKELQRKASASRQVSDAMRVNYSTGRKLYYENNPDKKPNGEKNPRFNPTEYFWENIFTGEKLKATRYEMIKRCPAIKSNISQVINKKYTHAKGWKIIGQT